MGKVIHYYQVIHETGTPGGEGNLANRRKYFRIKLKKPLCTVMKIIQINGEKVISKPTKVCIEDVGPGGVKFSSYLNLTEFKSFSVLLDFELVILNQSFQVQGEIVRAVEAKNEIFEYGVKFIIDETVRCELIRSLNKLQIYLKNNPELPLNGFCNGDKKQCLRSVASGGLDEI